MKAKAAKRWKKESSKLWDRWDLAARERNMRALLVRFFSIDNPGAYFDTNMAYLNAINTDLQDKGFNVGGEVQEMPALDIPAAVRLVIGLGICAGFMLMLMEIGFRRIALAGFVLSLVGWLGMYVLNQTLAMQLMALASVIEFPILSCLLFLPPKKDLSLPKAIGQMLLLCLVSWIGAVLMVGMLSDKAFMLKLSSFVGVKIAHVIPIVVVPFVLYIVRDKKPLTLCKNLLNKALDYKWGGRFRRRRHGALHLRFPHRQRRRTDQRPGSSDAPVPQRHDGRAPHAARNSSSAIRRRSSISCTPPSGLCFGC